MAHHRFSSTIQGIELNHTKAQTNHVIANATQPIGQIASQKATASAQTQAETQVSVAQNIPIDVLLDCNHCVNVAIQFATVAMTGASLSHTAINNQSTAQDAHFKAPSRVFI